MKKEDFTGVSLSKLTKIGVIVTISLVAGIVFLVAEIITTNNDVMADTTNYTICNDAIVNIREASYYLTDECRQYVETENYTHVYNYFREIERTKRRENAAESLNEHNIDTSNTQYNEALELSMDLEQIEIHVFKLMTVAQGLDGDNRVPQPVREYELSNYEKTLNNQQLMDRAGLILYSSIYLNKQSALTDALEDFRVDITDKLSDELEENTTKHTVFINLLIAVLILLFSVLFFAIVILNDALLKPINIYLECINSNIRMPLRGAVETKNLAVAFNNMYEKHKLYENDKKYEGKRDHLTGAVNSVGFNEVMFEIEHDKRPCTLMLLEIDDYEELEKYHSKDSINIVLIEVYNFICKLAEFKDDVFKIDKGLYCIIIFDRVSPNKLEIKAIYDRICSRLAQSKITSEVTLSAGVAFTDVSGFDHTLLNNANVALYQTKDNGGNNIGYYLTEE